MLLAAQVSIYPLRQLSLSPTIEQALGVFRSYGLEVTPGPMSSMVLGEDEVLFGALREAFRQTAREAEIVMTLTLSNACPVSK